jgi:hypothetical protein
MSGGPKQAIHMLHAVTQEACESCSNSIGSSEPVYATMEAVLAVSGVAQGRCTIGTALVDTNERSAASAAVACKRDERLAAVCDLEYSRERHGVFLVYRQWPAIVLDYNCRGWSIDTHDCYRQRRHRHWQHCGWHAAKAAVPSSMATL